MHITAGYHLQQISQTRQASKPATPPTSPPFAAHARLHDILLPHHSLSVICNLCLATGGREQVPNGDQHVEHVRLLCIRAATGRGHPDARCPPAFQTGQI